MKYHRVTIFLIIGMLFILFQSCKKDNSTDKSQYSIKFSKRALAYVKLTEGKYLIYKDSATSQLDSVIVTTSKLGSTYLPNSPGWFGGTNPAFNVESFQLVLTKFDGTSQTEWFNGTTIAESAIEADTAATLYLMESDTIFAFIMSGVGKPDLSVTIEGKTYNNVLEYTIANATEINAPHYKKKIYFWAKSVGIIKRTIITTGGRVKTYTLIRNN